MRRLGPVPVGGSNPVRIMGIINASPESFYKKSVHTRAGDLGRAAKAMEEEGADIIDVGGMSTAPYLRTLVPETKEIERVKKAILAVQKVSKLPISVDTCRAGVARAALDLGAEIINDVTGLQYDAGMGEVLREYGPSVVVCAYSRSLVSGSHVTETGKLLRRSISIATSSGVSKDRIVVDPAIGFFRKNGDGFFFTRIKSDWVGRDVTILQNLSSLKKVGFPILISVSRKSFIGKILGEKDPERRFVGSLAAETIAVLNGADIIRTHNVGATCDVVKISQELQRSKKGL